VFVESAITERAEQTTCPPRGPWQWSQTWRDLLFAHWQIPASDVNAQLPAALEADQWQGVAWVTAVAFRLKDVRLRGLPTCGPCSNLVELNLRTYVRQRGESAIYFFSIHADTWLTTTLARLLTPLPYQRACIDYRGEQETRAFRAWPRKLGKESLLDAKFRVNSAPRALAPGSLDTWLLERYRAHAAHPRCGTYRMAVEHPPWEVCDISLDATAPGLGLPWGFNMSRQPDLWHFSPGLSAHVWPFETLD
jgi:uncharacterized protein YqjF (DUF2071 family)